VCQIAPIDLLLWSLRLIEKSGQFQIRDEHCFSGWIGFKSANSAMQCVFIYCNDRMLRCLQNNCERGVLPRYPQISMTHNDIFSRRFWHRYLEDCIYERHLNSPRSPIGDICGRDSGISARFHTVPQIHESSHSARSEASRYHNYPVPRNQSVDLPAISCSSPHWREELFEICQGNAEFNQPNNRHIQIVIRPCAIQISW
jgi:hypothetical protein